LTARKTRALWRKASAGQGNNGTRRYCECNQRCFTMKTHRTRAIVLRRTNYGEADRIVQFLTPEGKVSVMARGVRREKSKLAGGIELFAICDVVVGDGKGDLGVLTSSRLVQFYGNILKD